MRNRSLLTSESVRKSSTLDTLDQLVCIAISSIDGHVGDDALYEVHRNRDFVNLGSGIKALAKKVCAGGVVPTFDRHLTSLTKELTI